MPKCCPYLNLLLKMWQWPQHHSPEDRYHFAEEIEEEETLSLQEKEIELIKKSLERNRGKRKAAAAELGISEGPCIVKSNNMTFDVSGC